MWAQTKGDFDTTITNDVFCSVPGPLLSLAEIERVLNPGGIAVFLEQVQSAKRQDPGTPR